MNTNSPAALLAQIPLFAALPLPDLERLAAPLRAREFAAGDLLVREGDSDDRCYLVIDGEAEVIKELGTSEERLLAIRPRGTLFGEMSIFDPQGRHTASVRARTHIQALEMTRQDLDALLRRHPTIVYDMVRQMSRRLEDTENATILDLREKNRLLTLAYHELQAAHEQIVAKEKLERELAIARKIQESILPQNLPRLRGFDIAALSVPARAVGGDYYDFITLEGERVGLVVGDACDKGIPAALFINLTNSLVHVEARRNASPEATLRLVNQHLLEVNRSGMFAALLYGILDASGRFDYCRAGHPSPLVVDAALRRIETGGTRAAVALGVLDEIQLDAHSVHIPPGGLMVAYSDGLSEAADAAENEFGVAGLLKALPEIGHLPAAEMCAELWRRIQEFGAGEPQTDDFTVVVIKREK